MALAVSSCNAPAKKEKQVAETPKRESCYPDSFIVKDLIKQQATGKRSEAMILSFYRKRNFLTGWLRDTEPNEYAGNFLNLLRNEITLPGIAGAEDLEGLQELYTEVMRDTSGSCFRDTTALKLEVRLTVEFFKYARRNWRGVNNDVLRQVNWFMVRKRLNYEQLLNDFLSSSRQLAVNEPVYSQYRLLKTHLQKYYDMELMGGWRRLPADVKLKPGDSSWVMPMIKQQLSLLGDLEASDGTMFYDSVTVHAMRRFQSRHGLKQDGVVGGKTLSALRVPVQERIYQLLVNMERCRWVPLGIHGDYIIVNIPAFYMQVYENDKPAWGCNVIVGKSNDVNNTIIFNDSLEFVVFSPYWNITQNIVTKETLPAIKKDMRYLQKNNLEIVDRSGRLIPPGSINWNYYTDEFPYIIRERPGKNNSLGLVKFLFPNPFDIYMHDTPAKNLFSKDERAFSHGCIRLEEPVRLAQYLLRDNPAWPPEKIDKAMNGGKEIFVKLRKKIPVFITYFTAWVDEAGSLNFRDDVYGHDAKMKDLLYVN